jgi:hypothetical protein
LNPIVHVSALRADPDERLKVEHPPTGWPQWLPQPDSARSPLTGWTRDHWAALADRLLLAARRHASPGHAAIIPPGPEGGYGRRVDGLEGFARTFLLAGFRLAGEAADPLNLAEWYATGIATGSDPASPERWPRLTEHPQAKVEAASIALILDLTREQIWNRLDGAVRERVVEYLAPAVGDTTYPRNNWLWFRIVVETFLRSVGGPWAPADIEEDLALHDSFERQDGWLADGDGRDFDHYTGWALHLYPTLWQRMSGAADLATDQRRERDRRLLDRYLLDARRLVGADGAPLFQGRSLIYRSAAAAPFWVGALAEVPSTPPGALRRAASGIVQHFAARGAPDAHGLLTLGWHGPWPALAQSYSGPSSPYWAAKGFLGLALDAAHPVWTAAEEPLPVEQGDFVRTIAAPGWAAHACVADGIVRISNHGTDHAHEGDQVGDSPLYARLGYSTATAPLLDEAAWTAPLEQSVCLIDSLGRATHRAGMRPLALFAEGGVAVAASTGQAHWLTAAASQQRHGSGRRGAAEPAGRLTVISLVRSAWEVRGAHIEGLAATRAAALRIGGWAVAAAGEGVTGGEAGGTASAIASGGGLISWVRALACAGSPAPARAGVLERAEASPLGEPARVPYLEYPVSPGVWVWTLVGMTRGSEESPRAELALTDAIEVTWPDGEVTTTPLECTYELPGLARVAANHPGAHLEYPDERTKQTP